MRDLRAFTLIELLVVIAIIAIVAGGSLLVIDPARRIHTAHNATRWADALSILSALKRYEADHDGSGPSTPTAIDDDDGTVQIIGNAVKPCGTLLCTGHVVASSGCGLNGLSRDLRPYLTDIPVDPITGTINDSRYYVNKDAYGIVTVGACDAEGEDFGGNGLPPQIKTSK